MEREPRILFLDTRPIRRGAQIFVHELKHRFSLEGIPVRRIFLYKENNYEQLPLNEQDLVLPFRDNHFYEKFPTIHPSLVKALAHEIKNFAPDVILCNGSRTLKYAAVVKKCYPSIKAKWVYRVIDSAQYWNKQPLTKYYYKHFVIPSMDGAVGVSQKSLDEMIQHYGFNKTSICIPRAIDVDYFANFQLATGTKEKFGIPNDAFVLLFLGNFTKQKRPDRFIQIIDGLNKNMPLVHGLMVGDGPLKNESMKQVHKFGLEEKITFAGYQQDVRPWISMSDILLLTSDTEGMPGVVLESGAMKKITISNLVGGILELIEDDVNGFIVIDGSINMFIEKVFDIYSKKNKRIFLEEINYQRIVQSNSIYKVSNSYLDYFKKIILD
jgi:glycosyltransferase involved in cell wall biosynthesis